MKSYAIQVVFDPKSCALGNIQQAFEHFCLNNSDRDKDNRREMGFIEPTLAPAELERFVDVVECPHSECEHCGYASVTKGLITNSRIDCLDFRLTDFDVRYDDAVKAHHTFYKLAQEFAGLYRGPQWLSKPVIPVFVSTLLYYIEVINTPLSRGDTQGFTSLYNPY